MSVSTLLHRETIPMQIWEAMLRRHWCYMLIPERETKQPVYRHGIVDVKECEPGFAGE